MMSPPKGWRTPALVLAVLVWVGAVLWRYQQIDSPEPVAALGMLVVWLAVFTLACLGGGLLVWRSGGRDGEPELRTLPVVLVAGAGVLMLLAALLSLAGWLRPAWLVTVLLGLALYGAWRAPAVLPACAPRLPRGVRVPAALVAVIATYTLLAVPTASPFYDQLHYLLAFPFHWLRSGHIVVFERHAYSFFPANMGLLYTYALAGFGAWAAQAVHWWMGALAVATAATIAGALAGPRAGWWAAAILASCPSVVTVSTWAGADLGVAAFGAAAWLTVLLASHDSAADRRASSWLLTGVLVGLAAGCKYLAVGTVGFPVFVGAMSIAAPRSPVATRVRRAGLLVAGAALAIAPWLARNTVATGNPTYPFLGSVFARSHAGARPETISADRIARVSTSVPELRTWLTLGTFKPEGDAGVIGPVLLGLVPLAAFGATRRRGRFGLALAAGAAAGIAGWGGGPLIGRYLLPALVPLAVLEAVGWQRLRTAVSRPPRIALTVLIAAVLGWSASGGTTPLELRRVACTLGRSSGEELMREYASYWSGVRLVNMVLPAHARVLLVGESRCFGIDRDVLVEDPFQKPLLVELAEACSSPEEIAARLRELRVTHLLVNWQEARRIAALNGRTEYLMPLSPEARVRLTRFLAACVRRVIAAEPVEVFALEGCDGR